MQTERHERLGIESSEDIVAVRQRVRARATELGMSLVDQTKIVTAASELARNTLEHGKGGSVTIATVIDGFRRGVQLTFEDRGPGIPDVNLALSDHYSTGGGLGLGLGGAKRLCDDFVISSKVGQGTIVTVVRWK